MKRSMLFSIILVVTVSLSGCLKKNCGCDPDKKRQPPVLFQYEYVNYAWGYRHHGFLIDVDGNVNGFRQPEKWIFPDSSGLMSESELEYNLAQCDTVCGKADTDDLEHKYNKIAEIRLGKIVNHGLVMADAGTGVLSAWYWNDGAGKFEQVFLVSNGDVFKENIHHDVQPVVDWLKKIGEKTNRFYWFDGQ